ncbi:hypothetical protein [Coleofasciculus sp. E1-EBD-02]|uniref:hypothetical protein n=1 Tax=Coleofasciculus sp. E1-EBD-02 TaxID=3068481 RepID=UPI0032FD4A92
MSSVFHQLLSLFFERKYSMKFQTVKASVALAATAVSLVGFTSIARAGEGGVAGAAAFTVEGTDVTGVAVSAAVGKQDAAAAAFNYAGGGTPDVQNSAFSLGSAGVISTNAIGDPSMASISGGEDPALGDSQGNSFTEGFSIEIGTASGESVVTAPVETSPAP